MAPPFWQNGSKLDTLRILPSRAPSLHQLDLEYAEKLGEAGKLAMPSIWFDHWLDFTPIVNRFPQFQCSQYETVSTLISGGQWQIPTYLPLCFRSYLRSASQIQLQGGTDSMFWPRNSKGTLGVNEAWHLLRLPL